MLDRTLLSDLLGKSENSTEPEQEATMTNSLEVFTFTYDADHAIRTVEHNNDIWFVAKDVCDVLGFRNPRQAINTHIDDDEKDVQNLDTPGGVQQMTIINESGLYTLILRSNKPNTKQFRKWVTGTVLPSIRKHGFYATPATAQSILDDPDNFIQVLQAYKEQKARNTELEAKNEFLEQVSRSQQQKINNDKPKVLFAEAVDASNDSILVGNFAKILRQNGIDIGQNRLFAWFRENGYLMSYGERYNMPSQSSMDKGLFTVKSTVINNPDGSTKVTHTTKITGKGQIFFLNLFVKERARHAGI